MHYEALLQVLASFGCDIGHGSNEGFAIVSRHFDILAEVLNRRRQVENDRYQIRNVPRLLRKAVGREVFDPQEIRQFCTNYGLPETVYDSFYELQAGPHSRAFLSPAQADLLSTELRRLEQLSKKKREVQTVEHQLRQAKLLYAPSLSIINKTGRILHLARYAFRSCDARGMWGRPKAANVTSKIVRVGYAMGLRPGNVVLDVGTGCGEYIPALKSFGVFLVVQDLLSKNLQTLSHDHNVPACGSEAVHVLSNLPENSVDFVVSNGLAGEYRGILRCQLLHEALRVSRSGVFFGWCDFPASEWDACGIVTDGGVVTVEERSVFQDDVEYAVYGEFPVHAVFMPVSFGLKAIQSLTNKGHAAKIA